jgi:ABC-type transport system involved in multi-copper enzyme maturation permease subunit
MPSEFEDPQEELQQEPTIPSVEKQSEEPPKSSWASKWRAASARWAKETGISYFSNPSARKDFKVQFRGNRSGWLFGGYLAILGLASMVEYWRISAMNTDPTTAQNLLVEFYQMITAILGVVISLVAPALAAGAIVAEKQRRSLDLVFTAPVRPRVYLIGKIIASYRFTWILLALSLPFTAMSVILGGASWGDVAVTYLLLSVQGLVFTSIGLLFSSITEKMVSALVYTYGAVIAYVYTTAALAAVTSHGNLDSPFGPMNPLLIFQSLGHTTSVLGVPIPNFLLAIGGCLVVVRLCLATAGAALTPLRPRERADLRLAATGAFALLTGTTTFLAQSGHTTGETGFAGPIVFACTAVLALFMPFLSCYGLDSEQNSRPNGLFSMRRMLTGTPAGALPYTLFTIAAGTAGAWLGSALAGWHADSSLLLPFAAYVAGFWTFFWACGRYVSSFLIGLKASRTLQFMAFVGVLGLPVPILNLLIGMNQPVDAMGFPFFLYILAPLLKSPINPLLLCLYGAVLAGLGWMLAGWSEGNLRRRLAKKGKDLGEIVRATGQFSG